MPTRKPSTQSVRIRHGQAAARDSDADRPAFLTLRHRGARVKDGRVGAKSCPGDGCEPEGVGFGGREGPAEITLFMIQWSIANLLPVRREWNRPIAVRFANALVGGESKVRVSFDRRTALVQAALEGEGRAHPFAPGRLGADKENDGDDPDETQDGL